MAVSLNERPILKGAAAEKFLRRHNELEQKAQKRADKVRRLMEQRRNMEMKAWFGPKNNGQILINALL